MANSIEISGSTAVCRRCGIAYGKLKGFFPVSYAALYKGTGYLPYCKQCVEDMYVEYLKESGSPKDATRQMCRKLDLYWNDNVFDQTMQKNTPRSVFTTYMTKVNALSFSGKSYDDTLIEENAMWSFGSNKSEGKDIIAAETDNVSDEVVAFWGPGYTTEMYAELEQRLKYYRSKMPNNSANDMNTEMLLRQIAMMEIDINKARADGRSVDKMANSLSSLLSQLQKPKKDDVDSATSNTPFGVWIKRWEDQRPVPDIDESLKDVDGIIRYILTWFYGHLAKMFGIKNMYSKMYEDEIERYRVIRPEYSEEDDETMINDIFGEGDRNAIVEE